MSPINLNLVALVVSILSMFFTSTTLSSPSDIDQWCDQTPYPNPCKQHLMSQKPTSKEDFLKMSIELAMQRAISAHAHNQWLGPKCRNHGEKQAWSDCLKLYQHTITILNQTIDSNTESTAFDKQTWLSAALTNLETCRDGFSELGEVSEHMLPLMSNDVSELISNALALNHESSSLEPRAYKDGFPSWVTHGDRKLVQSSETSSANVVVAKDGSGNYRTIKEALDAVPKRKGSERYVIYIKRGVYEENLDIQRKNIMLIGDGMRFTTITGNRSRKGGFSTSNSATVAVTGAGFIARGITFRNTAGPKNHQALALRSSSDLSVFYRCGFEGYQDTLCVDSHRQFYQQCYIYGTVDFIFGNAAAVLQHCMIYVRRPLPSQTNVITAHGRTNPHQNTGISILNSRVMAAPDLKPVLSSFKTYLGRPWKEYSRTVYIKTYLDSLVDPAGWLEWNHSDDGLNTLYYGEAANKGPGASTSQRVKWKGYRVIKSDAEASKFSVDNFIDGSSWLPATSVPFISGI